MLSYLIDYDTKSLLSLYEKDQIFPLIVGYFIENHIQTTPNEGSLLSHTDNFKCLDVSLDFLEFLLTSIPESVFDKIEHFFTWLLRIKASNRGGEVVLTKVSDLLNLS